MKQEVPAKDERFQKAEDYSEKTSRRHSNGNGIEVWQDVCVCSVV
jgi:hypothetical protein